MVGFDSYVDKGLNSRGAFGGNLSEDSLGLDYSGLFGGLTRSTQARGAELTQAAQSLFQARAAGIRGEYQDSSAALEDRLAGQGVNPLFGQAAIEEGRAGVASRISEAEGETQAQLHTGLAGLIGEDFESRGSLSLAQRQAKMQYYLARLSYHAARKGQNIGAISGLVGAGLTAGAFAFGGPAGAAVAGGATQGTSASSSSGTN
ncbi:MAG: hypothetical protein GY719_23685 [bacterium]|nr:hypothetical protein [bacterium]